MDAFKQLRIAATTIAATVTGLFRTAVSRAQPRVVLAKGDKAPDFELAGSDGQVHRLAESVGREAVIIAWFPKAFTGGCTAECESLGRNAALAQRYSVRIFGASADNPDVNRRFAASMGLTFPILSDPSGAVARAYGVLGASGFPSRWTFYIGLDGRLLDIDRHVVTASHGETVAARLEELGIPRRG